MKIARITRVAALLAALAGAAHSATLSVYLSAPGTQATFIGGALTETFNNLATGNLTSNLTSSFGTYQIDSTHRFNIQNANQYGGAGSTRYAALGAQSGTSAPVTLNLNANYNYFGFWWSAGDANNGITFYRDGVLLARFSTADLTTLLSPASGHVTAVNGTQYQNSAYYGNPNNGNNTGEPYSYVHILALGVDFNRIVFDNSNTTGTGFESDNHSVYFGNVNLPDSSVFVRDVPSNLSTPEPAGALLVAGGLGALWTLRRRGRRD